MIERARWGGPVEPIGAIMPQPATSLTVHHPYPHALDPGASLAQEIKEWMEIHRYHRDVQKWAGVGYNFGITQNGNVYELRGWGRIGAHAGTRQGNQTSIGVAFLVNGFKQSPSQAARDAFQLLRVDGLRRGYLAADHVIKLHSDWKATDCPGTVLAGWAAGQNAVKPAPQRLLKYGMRGEDVRKLQRQLNVTPATGFFGPITVAAVKNFQRKHGLEPDAMVGELTRAKLG